MGLGRSVKWCKFRESITYGSSARATGCFNHCPFQFLIVSSAGAGAADGRTFQHRALGRSVQVGAGSQRIGPKRLGCDLGATAWDGRTHSAFRDFYKDTVGQGRGLQSRRGRILRGRGSVCPGNRAWSTRNSEQCIRTERVDVAASVDGPTSWRQILHCAAAQETALLTFIRRFHVFQSYLDRYVRTGGGIAR